MSFVKSDSRCFRYHGRWEPTEKGHVSHWSRAYFEFCAKGTYVEFIFDDPRRSCVVNIDGRILTNSDSGNDMRYMLRDDKTHIFRLIPDFVGSKTPLTFKGIKTDGKLSAPPLRKRNYLFVGDELTVSGSSYSGRIPGATDSNFACAALGGIALCDGSGSYELPDKAGKKHSRIGMETAFYNLQCPDESGSFTGYDFGGDKFDAVFICLGLNDDFSSAKSTKAFKDKYVKFITDIASKWPNAPVYVVQPPVGDDAMLGAVEEAGKAAEALSGGVRYIATSDWKVETDETGRKPTADGYKVFAEGVMDAAGIKY